MIETCVGFASVVDILLCQIQLISLDTRCAFEKDNADDWFRKSQLCTAQVVQHSYVSPPTNVFGCFWTQT